MATETLSSINVPTIKLGELGVHNAREPSQQEWERVTHQLEQTLSQTGCAYLTQHGLSDDLVNDALSAGVAFFQLGMETKMGWWSGGDFTGYLKDDEEMYSSVSHDLKESFLFKPGNYSLLKKEPPPFKAAVTPLYDRMQTLITRLMTSLSLSLGKPQDYFAKMHVDGGSESVYRFNYYPGTTGGRKDLTGFGAHTDFSTFTLLFSSNTEGLQVIDSSGRWVDLPVLPGTMLIMAGEFLAFYSNKRFRAPMHRVVLPSENQNGRPSRCSLIFFVHADGHTPMWPPSDNPASPPPPSVKEFIEKKVQEARK